jgi:peptidyl-prolyl cis-trans isomerase D
VASVGDEEISSKEFVRSFNTQLNAIGSQLGQVLTVEQAAQFGVSGTVINSLAAQAAANKLAREMGLGVSETRLSDMVREDPSFAGTLGSFDAAAFRQVLQNSGFTEAEYFELQSKASMRSQLASGLFGGSPTPQAALDLVSNYANGRRTVEYFTLGTDTLLPVEPTEDDLVAYLAANQTQFRTRETRAADVLALTPETLAGTKTISEEEIVAEYERTRDSRQRVERRGIAQIVLTTPELGTRFETAKANNEPLAAVLAETGLSPAALGEFARSEITDPALAEAAFGLAAAGDYAVIEGIGGKRVVVVTLIEPGGQVTLDESREAIADQLALTAARAEYIEILDQVEELRAAFQPLAQIAERFALPLASVETTSDGAALAAVEGLPEADRGRVATSIFAASPDDRLTPTVTLGSNRNIFFDLKGVTEARDQTLDEVRDAVTAAWTAAEEQKTLAADVAAIIEQLNSGLSFTDVALNQGQFVHTSNPLTRQGDGTNVLNQTVAAAIFAGGPTHFGSAVNGDGDHVVYQVIEVTNPETPDATVASFVTDGVRDSLYQDFIAGLRNDAGVRINRQAIDTALGLTTTAQ